MSRINKEFLFLGYRKPETNEQRKEVKELLELAKLTTDESAFQLKHQYKKFKGIYMNILSSGQVPELMISGLYEIGFYNETIFWCKKIIENMRFCDKEKRSKAFHMITVSFCHLEDYENVFLQINSVYNIKLTSVLEPRFELNF